MATLYTQEDLTNAKAKTNAAEADYLKLKKVWEETGFFGGKGAAKREMNNAYDYWQTLLENEKVIYAVLNDTEYSSGSGSSSGSSSNSNSLSSYLIPIIAVGIIITMMVLLTLNKK